MKTVNKLFLRALMIGAMYFGLVLPVFPGPNPSMGQPEVQRITVTGATGAEKGDLILTWKNGNLELEFKTAKLRYRGFAIVDRTQAAPAEQVACDAKDAEYGSATLKDGSWLAVGVCGSGPSAAVIAIPAIIRARASADEANAEMKCWENKQLKMGVCFKASANPPSGPMPRTREHILLARQVG
jgi:hypothetical protein